MAKKRLIDAFTLNNDLPKEKHPARTLLQLLDAIPNPSRKEHQPPDLAKSLNTDKPTTRLSGLKPKSTGYSR
jgi:hypothetical protein